jgi:acetoin utilization protein AcuB
MIAVLTPFPHSVDVEAPIEQAREFMRTHDIRHLPVTENGELIGIVSDRDIKSLHDADPNSNAPATPSVRDAYVADPFVVDVGDSLEAVLNVMAERHLGSALVTKKGRLVGIFTSTDAYRHFAEFIRDRYGKPDGNDAA